MQIIGVADSTPSTSLNPNIVRGGGGGSLFPRAGVRPCTLCGLGEWIGRKNYSGVKAITRLRRVLCPASPDAYFNWIPASLHCSSFPPKAEMMNSSGENDGCLYFRRSLIRRRIKKPPNLVILAGRRGSSYGYVVTRSVTQPRRKPHRFGGGAAGCVQLRRTRILTGFALRKECSALAFCSAALEYNWPAIPGDNHSRPRRK